MAHPHITRFDEGQNVSESLEFGKELELGIPPGLWYLQNAINLAVTQEKVTAFMPG